MNNKLEKLDLFKLPSILFVPRTERWASSPTPAWQRNALDSCAPRLLLPSAPSSHMHRQTSPHKSKLAVFEKKCTQEPKSDLKI